MVFELDYRLERDTLPVSELPYAKLLLMNDRRYPWFIIVPTEPKAREWHDLDPALRSQTFDLSMQMGKAIKEIYGATKINTAALGNVVEQLHIHVVGRNQDDPAWPGPVWGHSASEPYNENELNQRLNQLKQVSILNFIF